jgi:hypothetical protein
VLLSYADRFRDTDRQGAKLAQETAEGALRWLAAEARADLIAEDPESGSGMEILALAHGWSFLPSSRRRKVLNWRGSGDSPLSLSIRFSLLRMNELARLDTEHKKPVEEQKHFYAADSRALALSEALRCASDALDPNLVEDIKVGLANGMKHIEQRRQNSEWGSPPEQATQLLGYVSSAELLGEQTPTEEKIVIQGLYSLLTPWHLFEDGSIFHDLYATVYFANCLVAIHDSWLGSRPIVEIYSNLLKGHDLKISDERERVFNLAKESIELQHRNRRLTEEIQAEKTKNRQLRRLWLVLVFLILLSVLAAIWPLPQLGIGHFTFTYDPAQTDAFLTLVGLVIGATAALVTGIEIVFFRNGHDGR